MMKKIFAAAFICSILASCGGSNEEKKAETKTAETPKQPEVPMTPAKDSAAAPDLSAVKLDADKDFVCGMPAKGYTSDTVQYKGKVYGFCSKDCKDEFLKNPESYLAKK